MVVGRAACWQPPCMEFVFCPLQLQQSVIVGIAVKSTSWYFHRKWREVSKMVFTDKYDHEVNIRRSRVTRRTSRFGGGIVLHWNFVFFCICNGDPIAILLSEDDKQARRWGLSHFGMSLSVSPAVHMESANVTAAMSFKSVLCQPCTLSLWHWLNKIKTF